MIAAEPACKPCLRRLDACLPAWYVGANQEKLRHTPHYRRRTPQNAQVPVLVIEHNWRAPGSVWSTRPPKGQTGLVVIPVNLSGKRTVGAGSAKRCLLLMSFWSLS